VVCLREEWAAAWAAWAEWTTKPNSYSLAKQLTTAELERARLFCFHSRQALSAVRLAYGPYAVSTNISKCAERDHVATSVRADILHLGAFGGSPLLWFKGALRHETNFMD
jgi:hypothetical protein